MKGRRCPFCERESGSDEGNGNDGVNGSGTFRGGGESGEEGSETLSVRGDDGEAIKERKKLINGSIREER